MAFLTSTFLPSSMCSPASSTLVTLVPWSKTTNAKPLEKGREEGEREGVRERVGAQHRGQACEGYTGLTDTRQRIK